MAGQTDFTLERAKEIREIVEEMFEAIPKSKRLGYLGHLNDVLLFVDAAAQAMQAMADAMSDASEESQ